MKATLQELYLWIDNTPDYKTNKINPKLIFAVIQGQNENNSCNKSIIISSECGLH